MKSEDTGSKEPVSANVDVQKKPKESVVSTSLLSSDKLMTLAGIPISVVLALLIQYFYHNYYVIPAEERTLLSSIPVKMDRESFCVVSPESIFTVGTWQPESLKFGVAWQSIQEDGSAQIKYLKSSIVSSVWLEGNGESFGTLAVEDDNCQINIQYVTKEQSSTMRIFAKSVAHLQHRLIFYIMSPKSLITITDDQSELVKGYDGLFGNYSFSFDTLASETTTHSTTIFKSIEDLNAPWNEERLGSNVAVGFNFTEEFNLEASFSNEKFPIITANDFLDQYNEEKNKHLEKFEAIYQLTKLGLPDFYQSMGQSALAHLLASRSYTYGELEAIGSHNPKFHLANVDLVNVFPSPNHNSTDLREQTFSLIGLIQLAQHTVVQVLSTWLNLMNIKGVVPQKVGTLMDYSQLQPPDFFLAIEKVVSEKAENADIFEANYLQLEKYALSLGPYFTSYEENLFQFPSSNSSEAKADVDLHCRMVIASRVMKRLSKGRNPIFEKWNSKIDNPEFLVRQFYDERKGIFNSKHTIGGRTSKSAETFSSAVRISSFCPLMFKLLPTDSVYLKQLLQNLDKDEMLWSNYGVRSISKSSSYGDNDNISISTNYLILGALKHYSEKSSEIQAMAHVLYSKLRNIILSNVAREFKRTKTLWEFYSAADGKGKGRKGFSESSLILHIMAEIF